MRKLAAAALILAWMPVAQADDTAAINKTVSSCLDHVHSLGDWNKRFDAYYNAATRSVENNAAYQADREALFQFNKCMAQHGYPLK
jgi:hypothetical protein